MFCSRRYINFGALAMNYIEVQDNALLKDDPDICLGGASPRHVVLLTHHSDDAYVTGNGEHGQEHDSEIDSHRVADAERRNLSSAVSPTKVKPGTSATFPASWPQESLV